MCSITAHPTWKHAVQNALNMKSIAKYGFFFMHIQCMFFVTNVMHPLHLEKLCSHEFDGKSCISPSISVTANIPHLTCQYRRGMIYNRGYGNSVALFAFHHSLCWWLPDRSHILTTAMKHQLFQKKELFKLDTGSLLPYIFILLVLSSLRIQKFATSLFSGHEATSEP